MSITDELRKYAQKYKNSHDAWSGIGDDLDQIADLIDAEHEKACAEAWNNGYEADFIDIEEWLVGHPHVMEQHGWIRLPKDADGEYIRIGDEMEGVDKYDSLKKVMGEVITVSFESDGTVDVAIQAWNRDGKSWHRAYLDPDASVYRHHHVPTVEDVLRGVVTLCHNTWKEGSAFEFCDVDDVMKSGNIAEYAAKLRLADDGKEQ